MAILFADGFDGHATANLAQKWTGQLVTNWAGGTPTVTINASGRTGANALRVTYASSVLTSDTSRAYEHLTLAPADATCIIGFAFKTSFGVAVRLPLTAIWDGVAGAEQITLMMNADLTLSVWRGNGDTGTLLGTTAVAISVGVWHYIELKALISDASGTYQVWIDGTSRLSGSSADTKATANASWSNVRLGYAAIIGGFITAVTLTGTWDYDDVYISDGTGSAPYNTALGDVFISTILADGEGGVLNFTASGGGTHYTMIDEVPPNDDSDYNSSAVVNDRDTYTFAAIAGTSGSVLATQTCIYARKDDAGVRTIRDVVRIGGVNYDGAADATLSSAYAYQRFIRIVDPATTVAWTIAGINAAEFGVKVTT